MSKPANNSGNEIHVPLSIVFMTIGTIVLLTAGAIFVLARLPAHGSLSLPALIPLAQVPTLTPTPRTLPPTPDIYAETTILLPATELVERNSGLPSLARADQAPTNRREPVAGLPQRLVIPSLDIDAPVWEVGLERVGEGEESVFQWQVPEAYAAGWHNGSALLGQPGNTVLNGHHNIYGELFRGLVYMDVGDEIILHDLENSYRYQVQESLLLPERGQPLEVRLENAQWIAHTSDERITIVSCWPYADNTHRVVVVATPLEND